MDSAFDHVTRALFAQLRGRDQTKDFDTLTCPRCSDRLEPLLLDFQKDPMNGQDYQSIWWTCRGLRNKSCSFPLTMPKNVFWTRRSLQQMREGLLPPPNIHLLPAHLHHLYPAVFSNEARAKGIGRMSELSTFVGKVPESGDPQANSEPLSSAPSFSTNNSTVAKRLELKEDTNLDEERVVKYGQSDSRKNVELFPDANSALSSSLSLRFHTDTFLDTINSEMSRKQLIKPPLAIGQKQRLRYANFVNKCEATTQQELPLVLAQQASSSSMNINHPTVAQALKECKSEVISQQRMSTATTQQKKKSQRKRVADEDVDISALITKELLREAGKAKDPSARFSVVAVTNAGRSGPSRQDHGNAFKRHDLKETSQFEYSMSEGDRRSLYSQPTSSSVSFSPENSLDHTNSTDKQKRSKLSNKQTFVDAELDNLVKQKYQEILASGIASAKNVQRVNGEKTPLPNTSQNRTATPLLIDDRGFALPKKDQESFHNNLLLPQLDFGDPDFGNDLTEGLEDFF